MYVCCGRVRRMIGNSRYTPTLNIYIYDKYIEIPKFVGQISKDVLFFHHIFYVGHRQNWQ